MRESVKVSAYTRVRGGRLEKVGAAERRGNAARLSAVGIGHVPRVGTSRTPISGAVGAVHPGRGPGGYLRNFRSMGDAKLVAVGKAVMDHPVGSKDTEVHRAISAELSKRHPEAGRPKKPTARVVQAQPPVRELLVQHVDDLWDDGKSDAHKANAIKTLSALPDDHLRKLKKGDLADLADAAENMGHTDFASRVDRLRAPKAKVKPKQ